MQPTEESCSSGISFSLVTLFIYIFEATLSIHYKTRPETGWWNPQRILRLGFISQILTAYTLGTQNGWGGEEKRMPSFSNGNSDPQWTKRWNSKALTQQWLLPSCIHRCNAPLIQQGSVSHYGKNHEGEGKLGLQKHTSVSVSPLIPFNPSELMSSFTTHHLPHPFPAGKGLWQQGQGPRQIPLM